MYPPCGIIGQSHHIPRGEKFDFVTSLLRSHHRQVRTIVLFAITGLASVGTVMSIARQGFLAKMLLTITGEEPFMRPITLVRAKGISQGLFTKCCPRLMET